MRSYISTIIKVANLLAIILSWQKPISILVISILVTDGNKKVVRVLCIYYLVEFQEE